MKKNFLINFIIIILFLVVGILFHNEIYNHICEHSSFFIFLLIQCCCNTIQLLGYIRLANKSSLPQPITEDIYLLLISASSATPPKGRKLYRRLKR
jgi:hypothetical protein